MSSQLVRKSSTCGPRYSMVTTASPAADGSGSRLTVADANLTRCRNIRTVDFGKFLPFSGMLPITPCSNPPTKRPIPDTRQEMSKLQWLKGTSGAGSQQLPPTLAKPNPR